ncbi:protein of unknown function [Burkholderia multivorans]
MPPLALARAAAVPQQAMPQGIQGRGKALVIECLLSLQPTGVGRTWRFSARCGPMQSCWRFGTYSG